MKKNPEIAERLYGSVVWTGGVIGAASENGPGAAVLKTPLGAACAPDGAVRIDQSGPCRCRAEQGNGNTSNCDSGGTAFLDRHAGLHPLGRSGGDEK